VNRRTLTWTLVIGVPVAALVVWIASNTYWADLTVPMPMRGEAATNPHYAAQRFVEALGGRTTREQSFSLPAPGGVVVLSVWNWNLIPRRRDALEAWVERGGRLVMDDTVQGGPEFVRWSGIEFVEREREDVSDDARDEPEGPCFDFAERIAGKERRSQRRHLICDVDVDWTVETTRAVDWEIDEGRVGRQGLRVRVGRGSVTVINGQLFTYRKLFDGDHGWLLAAATQLRPGD
jgi:hypothetical protein